MCLPSCGAIATPICSARRNRRESVTSMCAISAPTHSLRSRAIHSVIRTALMYPLCDRCRLEIADKALLRSAGQSFLLRFTHHRHETHRQRCALFQLTVFLFEQVKLLCKSFADGNDHASVVFKLIYERLRNLVRGAGHNNRVERRLLRPALVTVAHSQMHVLVT